MTERDLTLDNVSLHPDDANRLIVRVGKFDVCINHTHEGVIIDVWPYVAEDEAVDVELIGTLALMDSDADACITPAKEW